MRSLFQIVLAGLLGAAVGVPSRAQNHVVSSTNPQRKGTGNLTVSFQSYYNRVNSRTVSNTQGSAVNFRYFFPRHGLLSLNVEPGMSHGSFGSGETSIAWTGLPWAGRHWDFSGGDFRAATALVDNPFGNVQLPEAGLRGARVTARSEHWESSVYAGVENVAQGNRVAFRRRVPQSAFGAQTTGRWEDRLQLGLRLLHLATSEQGLQDQAIFFSGNRRIVASTALTSQANVKLNKQLAWFSEVSLNRSQRTADAAVSPSALNWVVGPTFDNSRLSVRANYMRQGIGYLPLPGFYVGDRRGPNVDATLHLGRLNLNGTWLQTRNNLERDPETDNYYSRQTGGGFHLMLPAAFSVSGAVSQIGLESRSPENETARHRNRLYLLNLSRPVYRHNLRGAFQRTDIWVRESRQRLRFFEVEDTYSWRKLTAGGAVRWQQFAGQESKSSLFIRSSMQWSFRRMSAYGYWEQGKDLANETLFATEAISTSLVGVSWDSPQQMSIRLEAFRSRQNSTLNPENLFVLSLRGAVPDVLNRTNDWNVYLRVSKQFGWGAPLLLDALGAARFEPPLTGTVAGYVKLRTLSGNFPAAQIWLESDTGVRVLTDPNGYFQLPEIPQGTRLFSIDVDRLPADFSALEGGKALAEVRPDQIARIELAVEPLQYVEGVVRQKDGTPAPEGVTLRLLPADRYTTTDQNGQYGFYNLPEGDYRIQIVAESLPPTARLEADQKSVSLRYGAAAPALEFIYEIVQPAPKPVHNIIIQERPAAVGVPKAKAVAPRKNAPKPIRAVASKAGQTGKPTPSTNRSGKRKASLVASTATS